MNPVALAPVAAFLVCVLTLFALLRGARLPLDQPNARSLHTTPVPRVGGVALMAGVVVAALLLDGLRVGIVLAAALAAVSFIDDLRGLPARVRLACHAAAAAGLLAYMAPGAGVLWLALYFLGIVWMTNLYNFMDGSDGLAGGMAVIGQSAYALAAWSSGAGEAALVFASIAAAGAGFLLFNFPPARVFLGDVGSIPLGFLAAAGGLFGVVEGLWPVWFPLLVFSPFAVDATFTLAKRALRGERVWQAHRDHYYQRLVRMGWGHRRTALAEYAIMIVCAMVALASLRLGTQGWLAVAGGAALVYFGLALLLERSWRLHLLKVPNA